MNILKRSLKILGAVLAVVVIIVIAVISYASLQWDKRIDRPVRELTASRDSASVARGEFLYKTSLTCWTCHGGEDADSPPSGGMKFDLTTLSPSLGVYYARNITPDPETGIGSWTDGEIVKAIREGIRKDGTVLFPIMPVDPLNGLSDEDVLAVVAYLRSISPVRNQVAQREPSLFAKTLMTFGAIGPAQQRIDVVAAPPRALTPPYGAYVAKHASLCSDCHTPRNLMDGSFYYDSLLAGSSIRFGEGEPVPVASFAPNPFNPATVIEFSLPSQTYATLKVYNALGAEVASLISEELPAGRYTTSWDAQGMASGVYYCRLMAGNFVATKRLVLLK